VDQVSDVSGTRAPGTGWTFDEVRTALREELPELEHRHGVRSIEVFGSYVRGEQRRTSEVDLLVEFEPGRKVSLYDLVTVEQLLSDRLGVRVDLVEKRGLKPALRERILEEAVPV
jgi:uncharacterized protein